MKIAVSGVSYYVACDPQNRDTPREEGWPEPTAVPVGKGMRYVYEGDADLARKILAQLEEIADAIGAWGDAEQRAEARACRRDAERIRAALSPATSATTTASDG